MSQLLLHIEATVLQETHFFMGHNSAKNYSTANHIKYAQELEVSINPVVSH
jgi:hypothetical protein